MSQNQSIYCHRCGLEGHISRNCVKVASATMTNGSSPGLSRNCYKCGLVGHIARDCGGGIKCYNCEEMGHISRNCPQPQRCNRCKKEGHVRIECPEEAADIEKGMELLFSWFGGPSQPAEQ